MYGYRNPAPVAFYSERYSPVPGWGMCPNLAGDPIIGIGQDDTYGAAGALSPNTKLGLVAVGAVVIGFLAGRWTSAR